MARTQDRPDALRRRLGRLSLAVLAALGCAALPAVHAQGPASAAQTVPAAPAAPTVNAHPTWNELSPAHQRILAPLQPLWNTMPELNRHKWLRIAERYPRYSPGDQERLQARMAEWVRMTPQQRRLARENYQITRSLPPETKAEAWQRYQQLSDEQKKKLAAADKVPRRPGAVSALPSGKHLPPDTSRQIRGTRKSAAPAVTANAATPAAPGATTSGAASAATAAPTAATSPLAAPAAVSATAPTATSPASTVVSPPAATAPLAPPVTGEASTEFPVTAPAENR